MHGKALKNRIKPNAGAAMIVSLCMMAFMIAIGTALFLSSATLVHAAQQKYLREQCYQLAKSFSIALRDQLDYQTNNSFSTTPSGESGSLIYQMYYLSEYWPVSDDPSEVRELNTTITSTSMSDLSPSYEDVTLFLSKVEREVAEQNGFTYDYDIYLTVRVKKSNVFCDYTTTYYRSSEKQAYFRQNFYDAIIPVYPDGNMWYYNSGDGRQYLDADDYSSIFYQSDNNTKYAFWYQHGG